MNFSDIIFGAVLLLAGRKFFWLFVGIVGFLIGMDYGGLLLGNVPPWMVLFVSVMIGILGAVIAVFAQWMVIGFAGFAGGGYLFVLLAQMFMPLPQLTWAVFLIGGIVGAAVTIFALDLALIVISSLMGAALIVGSGGLFSKGSDLSIMFFILTLIGIVLQWSMMGSGRSKKS